MKKTALHYSAMLHQKSSNVRIHSHKADSLKYDVWNSKKTWQPEYYKLVHLTHKPFKNPKNNFYRAMLCIRGTSHGPVSVRPSVCLSVRPSQVGVLLKRLNTTHDSLWTLVFWCQRSPRNSTGVTSCGGAKCRWGGSKSATFDK